MRELEDSDRRNLSMEQAQHTLVIETRGPGFTDLTAQVAAWLGSIAAGDGLLTLFVRHTSCDFYTFRDDQVTQKDSYWKIVDGA